MHPQNKLQVFLAKKTLMSFIGIKWYKRYYSYHPESESTVIFKESKEPIQALEFKTEQFKLQTSVIKLKIIK